MLESKNAAKTAIPTIAAKNKIIANILAALEQRDGFLLIGHKNPDDDCIASLVAFGLLAGKFNRRVYLYLGAKVLNQYEYLLSICRYNSIKIIREAREIIEPVSTIVALDTPKPEMLESPWEIDHVLSNPDLLKIEFDHHLEADARYFGDLGYRLVTRASSSSELVGLVAIKLQGNSKMKARHQIVDVFTRNLVLAVLTGMIGDTKMGKFLKTKRDRWFYEWFSALFDQMLNQKTRSGSGNFTSKEDVYNAITSLSSAEEKCFSFIMEKEKSRGKINYVALSAEEAAHLFKRYGNDTFVSVAKSVADALAERNGTLGLLVYPDDPDISSFVQFKLRRSQSFGALDLRTILEKYSFTNGGGHPGAIGFRFEKGTIPDLGAFVEDLMGKIERLVG